MDTGRTANHLCQRNHRRAVSLPDRVTTDSRRTCLENRWWPTTSTLSTSWPRADIASSAGTVVGVLNPWPSDIAPHRECNTAAAFAGGPYTVASGGTVTLNGSATGDAPLTFAWSAPAQGTLSALNIAGPVYTAPTVATHNGGASATRGNELRRDLNRKHNGYDQCSGRTHGQQPARKCMYFPVQQGASRSAVRIPMDWRLRSTWSRPARLLCSTSL